MHTSIIFPIHSLSWSLSCDSEFNFLIIQRDEYTGVGFTQQTGSQQWSLGVIGNWNNFDTDLNGDGQYQSANDRMVAGSFNEANEVTQLARTEGSTTNLTWC